MPVFSCLSLAIFLAVGTQAEPAFVIPRLGSSSYQIRHQATDELIAIGPRALPMLRKALMHPDLEMKHRAAFCIEVIECESSYSKLMNAYERQVVLHERLAFFRGRCMYHDMELSVAAHAATIPGLEQQLRSRGVGEAQLQAMKAQSLELHRRYKARLTSSD